MERGEKGRYIRTEKFKISWECGSYSHLMSNIRSFEMRHLSEGERRRDTKKKTERTWQKRGN